MSSRVSKILSAVVLSTCCAASPSARAGAEEDNALAAFEGACLDNLSNPAQAAQIATAGGLIEVQEPQRSVLLDGKSGRVWFSNASGARQFLKLADNGACSISAPYADDRTTLELFKKHSRNRLVKTENIGSEVQSIFVVTHPDPRGGADGHAIVTVQTSALKTCFGVSLTSLPESVARAGGISEQKWP
jgi:hypothetical protein